MFSAPSRIFDLKGEAMTARTTEQREHCELTVGDSFT
jgi:hypothetical protein